MSQNGSQSRWEGDGAPLLEEQNGRPVPSEAPSPGFSIEDILFALYRHRWLVITFSLLGFGTAAFLFLTTPKTYRSDAKLMVKYVPETETVGPGAGEGPVRSPVLRGDVVVSSELQIIENMDLCRKVAEAVGPTWILSAYGGGNNLTAAAGVIRRGIKAWAPEKNNVITVSFSHPDPSLVQPVLTNFIEQYFAKHYEVHRSLGNLSDYESQLTNTEAQLIFAENQLLALQKTNGVFSLEDSKKSADAYVKKAEDDLQAGKDELELKKARLGFLKDLAPILTNEVASAGRQERVDKYSQVVNQLDRLRRQEQQYLEKGYVQSGVVVQPLRTQIEGLEKEKKKYEIQDPSLSLSSGLAALGNGKEAFDPEAEAQNIKLLEFKIGMLSNQVQTARTKQSFVYDQEQQIGELQRRKKDLEQQTEFFRTSLAKAKFESGLGASRDSNISKVESPTTPILVVAPLYKQMGLAAAAGMGIGVGLALLLEMFLDQRVKRPMQVRNLLPVPLYLAIPRRSKRKALALAARSSTPASGPGEQEALDERVQPYFEALRDRVLNRFETLARKPKLVGVCACSEGPGATNTAAGLAAALSEAGALKVLLVDMKSGRPSVRNAAIKNNGCTLVDALETEKRQGALVAPNLYLASGGGAASQPWLTSPTKFTTFVPQLNASDYDYIVFDMPPVNEVSITPRIAKHMDLTLLVVEAERTHKRDVKRAGSLLLEFTPNLAVVLNDMRADLPKWLQ